MKPFVASALLAAMAATARAESSAETLFGEGQVAFDRGDYATAIARWQSSYELSRLPLLILNIAQANRLAGDCAHALSAYRQYISLDPASEQRGLAAEFIAELEPKCGASRQQVDQRPLPRERSGSRLKVAGLVVGGSGVAIVATGLFFGRRASSLGDDVARDCAVLCEWGEQKSSDARGRRYAKIGYALDAVGVAGIAAGALMYYLGDRQRPVLVVPRHDGAVVSWSASW